MLDNNILCSIDMLCVIFIVSQVYLRSTFTKRTRTAISREYAFYIIGFLALVDDITTLAFELRLLVAYYSRPVMFLLYFRGLRECVIRVARMI